MNIKDIARIAGVSASTVSKIINNKDDSISEETRERVLSVIRQYHYTPYAKVTSQAKTWRIAAILRSSVSFDTTLDGIIQTAQTAGYGTVVFNSYSDAEQERRNINALNKHNIDGVIWEPATPDSPERFADLERTIPWLAIGPNGGNDSLLLPYWDAAYKLTEQLIAHGHTSIGCLMTQGRRTKDFLAGFRACLFDHHLDFDESRVFFDLNDTLIEQVGNHAITGFVSSHYRKALEFHQLMASLHHRLPEDVSLVSIKNDTTEQLAYPGNVEISTYTIRNADFGSYLCGKLIDEIEKKPDSKQSFVQEFHLDSTCTIGPPAHADTQKITVIGSINIDTYLSVPNLPKEGTTVSTRTSATYPGGKGINQAVGVAKLGHRVALIGNVGSDMDADYIYKALAQWDVDATGVRRRRGAHTGRAYIFVNPHGASMISVLSGANDTLTPDDIHACEHLLDDTAYCLIQSEIPLHTVAAACRAARRHGARTILKPSSCASLPDDIARDIDILVPNVNELDTLVEGEGRMEDKAAALIERGVHTVIVTMGEQGCYLLNADEERRFPAEQFPSTDDTGAGDAFIAALASYLFYGYDLRQAIRIATYAAGYSTAREGVIPSLIDRYTLETRALPS